MKALRLALALGAMLFATACLPVTSKSPIGTTAGLGADPALIGTWTVQPGKNTPGEDTGPAYIHFVADKDGTMRIIIVETGTTADKHGEWAVYSASSAHLGGHDFLNVRALFDKGKPVTGKEAEETIPLLYHFKKDGTLAVAMLGEDETKAAIKAGKIDGTVNDDTFGDVAITAAAEKLDAFFATDEGAGLFTEKLLLLKPVK